MIFESRCRLVKTLTRLTLETLLPEKLATFEDEFAVFTLAGGTPQVGEQARQLKTPDHTLDTTLVAGMFFQVLVEAEQLPANTLERVSYVRKQAKNYLVNRLAGQISLTQFFRLLNLIDQYVQNYFSNLRGAWIRPPIEALSQAAPFPATGAIDTESLRQALAHFPRESTGRRKLNRERLLKFLLDTGGGWFKLLDFENFFQVNKKTAWAYLNRLLEEGVLTHNGEKANKVRYTLNSRFRDPGAT